MRSLLSLSLCLCAYLAVPAAADDGRVRFVPGGQQRLATQLESTFTVDHNLGSVGDINLGVSQTPGQVGRMAVGGFAAWHRDDVLLKAATSTDNFGQSAKLSAGYNLADLGVNGVASIGLGLDILRESVAMDPAQIGNVNNNSIDWSLSLSYSHVISPNLSLGGFALTEQPNAQGRDYRIGAGMGLKF